MVRQPEKTLRQKYKPSLIGVMSFKDSRQYSMDTEFTRLELATPTPDHIVRWMRLKVYGTPDPTPDQNPTKGRANSIAYAKKAISHFVPNRLMTWNEMSVPPAGNPTKSAPVNDLIKFIKMKEVRKQGKASQARRHFEQPEYEKVIDLLESCEDEPARCFSGAIYRFQTSMIGRIDDCAKFSSDNLTRNFQHSEYSCLARLCWSKNVRTEKDAPQQILLGASNPHYCVLLGLSTWIELSIGISGRGNQFIFNYRGSNDPITIKDNADAILKKVLKRPEFELVEIIQGSKGTHSMRKFATTFARRNGCNKDDTDLRARWKGKGRQQDDYSDTTLPYPDAKVCAALCKGGPVHYKVRENSGISNQWILDFVVPNTRSQYCESVSLVLGRALLWRIFDPEESEKVPASITNRVIQAYGELLNNILDDGINPIKKVALLVTGDDAEVFIDVLLEDEESGNETGGALAGGAQQLTLDRRANRMGTQELNHMNSLLLHLREDNKSLMEEMQRMHEREVRLLKLQNKNLRKLMRQPALMHGVPVQRRARIAPVFNAATVINDRSEEEAEAAEEEDVGGHWRRNPPRVVDEMRKLTRNPRSIHELWDEWQFGIGNRIPAKDFTSRDRGNCKYTFHRRKVVWDKVSEMVRSGWNAVEACHRIYTVYGRSSSVTQIINAMRKDRKTGGHPGLRTLDIVNV